ncbi:gag-pol polyprotein [Tanacetum coccineum]
MQFRMGIHIIENIKGLSVVSEIANQYGNGNVKTAPAEGNGNGINSNPIRDPKSTQEEFEFMAAADAYEKTERVKVNCTLEDTLQQASTSRTQFDNAPVYDSDRSTEVPKDENSYDHDIFNMLTHEVQYTDLQTELDRTKEKLENCIIKKEKNTLLWNNWYTKCEECKYDKISYDKAYNDMQQKTERFQAQLGDLKVDKTNALSKPVTSNSAPSTRESKVVQTVNVISPRIFRPNSSKTSRVDNVVPNKPVKISIRIKPIIVSQPNVIHKQQANSDSNGFSSTKVNNTAKTRRPHPMSNSNTDRVPSKSKSSCLSNKVKKIEENHRNSQIPKNQKHMSSECNNIMLAIRNAKSEIVCVMCKQCLVTVDHDVYVLNYVNNMNSRDDNRSANVSIRENQKKHKANAKKSKELGSKGSLASSRPSKPRTCLRWIPTGIFFAMCGKLTASSNTENKSKKSMYDNASTSNPSEPSSKGFPISTSLLGSDQHKKLLDSVMLNKLKHDGEVEMDEEEATEEVIRSYKTIREKNDPGVFVLPILIEAKFDSFALANTGSNINVIPYRIYAKLGREEVKPVSKKITMLDHSKAEQMGILKDVLCQVGVTTILAKFLILDIPVDKDVPIVVRKSFLYTCGGIINTIKGTTSTFDGVCYQKFYVAAVRNKHEKSDKDEEEYYVETDEMGKPIYGQKFVKYLNYDDPIDCALALQEAINSFRKIYVWKKMVTFLGSLPIPLQHNEWNPSYYDNFIKKGDGDGKWHAKVRIVDPYGNFYDQGPQIYAPCIVDWGVLNNMSRGDIIEELLEIKVYKMKKYLLMRLGDVAFDIREPIYAELCHEFYATYEFDKVVFDEDLMSKKLIKFRLGGRGHTLTILEFARRLGLYTSDEIQDEGFETYFRGGLRNDDSFNNGYANVAWLIAKWLKRKGVGIQRESMICCGQFMTKIARRANMLTDEVLDGLSYPIYCRLLDTTTLRELIDSSERLIAEEPAPGDPRGELERMSHRQSYHSDRYVGLFEYMAGHYNVPLQGDYAPPSYDEKQDEE